MQHAINERDVVVAIIGGTLLALALTRPKLDWVEKLEDSSRSTAEVLITVVAFAMSGYAYGSLYIVLHRQLGGDINKLLRGAGAFFLIYALSVHFEPFSKGHGWQELGSAIVLYITVAIASILGGVVFVEYTLSHSVSGWPTLIWQPGQPLEDRTHMARLQFSDAHPADEVNVKVSLPLWLAFGDPEPGPHRDSVEDILAYVGGIVRRAEMLFLQGRPAPVLT
jgi:hypothetical protein